MPTVRIPHRFFIDERKKLYNWKPDFWRELLQNSIDAGARNIEIGIYHHLPAGGGQEKTKIVFEDDGCGMTRDILNHVYFALGETTKNSGDTVGGFGRARIMTCFGHDSYGIHTLDSVVTGCGAVYEIEDADEHLSGTLVSVVMSDTTPDEMEDILLDYLRTCNLNVNVTINDKQFTAWIPKGRKVRELSFGEVRVMATNPVKPNYILFQVHGMTMFSKYVNCRKQVIVDINPERAREVLSANRNSLTAEVSGEVDRWISEISVDQTSALKDRTRYSRSIQRGNLGLRRTSRRKVDGPASPLLSSGKVSLPSTTQRTAAFAPVSQIKDDIETVSGTPFVSSLHDIMILNETDDRSLDTVIDRYNPRNWTVEFKKVHGRLEPYNRGREAYRLLIAYAIAVEEALNVLIDTFNLDDIAWSVGWCFGDYDGMHTEEAGGHIMLLNPIKDRKQRYKLTSKSDLLQIIAIAKHEVAHVYRDIHDELFANTLTEIDGLIDDQKVVRRIKDELKALNV